MPMEVLHFPHNLNKTLSPLPIVHIPTLMLPLELTVIAINCKMLLPTQDREKSHSTINHFRHATQGNVSTSNQNKQEQYTKQLLCSLKYQISPPSLEQYVQCKKRTICKRKINGNTINKKINVGVILLWHDIKQQSALTKYQTIINTKPNNNQQHKSEHLWTNQNNNGTRTKQQRNNNQQHCTI